MNTTTNPLQVVPGSIWGCAEFAEDTLGYGITDAALRARIPVIDPLYSFRPRLLRAMRTSWMREITESGGRTEHEAREPVLLIGPPGSGKTTLAMQMAARLGIPVFNCTFNASSRVASLVQSTTLAAGTTLKQNGPLVQAMLVGGWFIANELNMLHADELALLNDFLETGRITIPDTGQVITAKRGFWFIATMNPSRSQLGITNTTINVGAKEIAPALLRRFDKLIVEFPDEAEELALLERAVPALAKRDAQKCVRVARDLRNGGFAAQFATAQLIRFGRKLALYKASLKAKPHLATLIPSPALEALDEVFANGLSPEQQAAARKLCTDAMP